MTLFARKEKMCQYLLGCPFNILFVLQICEYCEGQSFMSNPPQAQRIIKGHLQFFTRLTLSHSLSLTIFFFFKDFSSKFV